MKREEGGVFRGGNGEVEKGRERCISVSVRRAQINHELSACLASRASGSPHIRTGLTLSGMPTHFRDCSGCSGAPSLRSTLHSPAARGGAIAVVTSCGCDRGKAGQKSGRSCGVFQCLNLPTALHLARLPHLHHHLYSHNFFSQPLLYQRSSFRPFYRLPDPVST